MGKIRVREIKMKLTATKHSIYIFFLILLLIIDCISLGSMQGLGQDNVTMVTLTVLGGFILVKLISLIRQLQHHAYIDSLTSVWNRRYLQLRLTEEIKRYSRIGYPICLLMIDIDNLKQVNDSEGHDTGDDLIKMISGVLLSNTRGYDVVTRWGGDEFAILLPGTTIVTARSVAERIRADVETATYCKTTVSIGLATVCPQTDFSTLFSVADSALYRAKKEKNSVAIGCDAYL